jgi:hypothetical protein
MDGQNVLEFAAAEIIGISEVEPMRHLFTILAIGLVSSYFDMPVVSQERSEGEDLLGRNLKSWERTGSGRSPWALTPDGILTSDGKAESFVHSNHFGNGTLSLEWRFVPTEPKRTGHSASLTVRGGEGEFATRIALGEDCGTLTTTIISSTDKVKTLTSPITKNHAKKIGEWNTMKVVMKGNEIKVNANGQLASSTTDCSNETGHIALTTTGYAIEFRNGMWKDEK